MIDIHSHIRYVDGLLDVEALLQDMERYDIQQRVISYMGYDNLQKHNQDIVDVVRLYPQRLKACALINPMLSTAMDDIKHALSMDEVCMIEFNSFEHGYYPDNCEQLYSIFDEINKNCLPVKVFCGLGAKSVPQQWRAYVKKYPNITFIFLHMGCFDYGYGCVDLVKEFFNARIETSNQYELQILRKAFQQLPMEKIMFGTCYPERLTRSAIEIFDLFPLTKEDIMNVQFENANTLLRKGVCDV